MTVVYLGTHNPEWLTRDLPAPLMVSRNRLLRFTPGRPARVRFVIDSGGFTELHRHGRWTVTPERYAAELAALSETLGPPDWSAPQDWMCEPSALAATGRTIAYHQSATVDNYAHLRDLGADVIPVLQGWTLRDYRTHADQYAAAGFDLARLPVIGLGSVCRRASTPEIIYLVRQFAALGFRLHLFGARRTAIRRAGPLIESTDSLAWSMHGRRNGPCVHLRSRCANHQHYALSWWADLNRAAAAPPTTTAAQLALELEN